MMHLIDFPPEIARQRMEALYRCDQRGRLVSVNEWDGGAAPRFHLMRTARECISRFHADLADDIVARLEELCVKEPSSRSGKLPALHSKYLERLACHAPVVRVWAGPVFAFPDDIPTAVRTVSIDDKNAHLLRGGFEDWLPDIRHRQPFKAVVESDRAVAICASVRISDAVHCAGVETLVAHRRRGHAARAVSVWGSAVRSLGAMPFYSTSWDNDASQRLAARLHLALVGVDYHVT